MLEALIGIIVLQVVVFAACATLAVRAFRDSQERTTSLLSAVYNHSNGTAHEERQWWQHQLQVALNRTQFPDIAAMQSAGSAPGEALPAEVEYMDEKRERELQES